MRIDDYRQNARACRELAGKMTGGVRDHLLSMAREWDALADDQERARKRRDEREQTVPD